MKIKKQTRKQAASCT